MLATGLCFHCQMLKVQSLRRSIDHRVPTNGFLFSVLEALSVCPFNVLPNHRNVSLIPGPKTYGKTPILYSNQIAKFGI